MVKFSNRSVQSKIVLIVLITTLSSLILSLMAMFYITWNNAKDEAMRRAKLDGALFSELTVSTLLFNDKVGATQILSKFHNLERVTHAHLFDSDGQLFAVYHPNNIAKHTIQEMNFEKKELIKYEDDSIVLDRSIYYEDEYFGHLQVLFSMQYLEDMRNNYIKIFTFIVLLLVLFSYFVAQKMQGVISKPILKLLSYMNEVSRTGEYKLNITKVYNDEIGMLYDGFKKMLEHTQARKVATIKAKKALHDLNEELEERVASRTKTLNDVNIELQSSIDTIKKTQSQLIQSEKMAALGGLVAGVAHEINTPIGLSVTGITHLQDTSISIKKLYEKNEMTQDDFENYLNTNVQLCESIYLNLKRAAELVASFKKVATDQSLEEKRSFFLKEYLEQVLISLRSKLKQTRITVYIDCDEKLEMYNDAGAIAQVFTNLVMNSIIHAYDERQVGKIVLTAERKNNKYYIVYKDDGKGIKKDILPKVFDPFFTTNRDAGGTGLGLNIIYNIVTSSLGGEISVESEVGSGTVFTIVLPLFLDERLIHNRTHGKSI